MGRLAAHIVLSLACAWPAGASAALVVERGPPETPLPAPSFDTWREIGVRDGLPQSTVYALAQDREGYVWAGTEAGVARYDGRRWQPIAIPGAGNAPPHGVAIVATEDGAIWVGTDIRGLLRWNGHALEAFGASQGLPSKEVRGVVAASRDGVWIATPEGVARCNPKGCDALPSAAKLDAWGVLPGRTEDDAPALWVATNRDGVYRIDDPDGSARLADWHVGMKDGLPADTARALAQFGGPGGRDLWIATGYGVSRLSGERLVVYGEAVGLTSSTASALATSVDDDGKPVLLAALQRGGLVAFRDDGSWRRESLAQGLPDDALYSILLSDRDRKQPRMWLGTQGTGVVRREAGRWHVIDTRHGLPGRAVRAVGWTKFPDGGEGYYIGTVAGSVRLRDGRWQRLGPPQIADAIVYDIAPGTDGSLWVGSDRGLMHWRSDDSIDVLDRTRTQFPANTIVAVYPTRDEAGNEELWIGARHGLARLLNGKLEKLRAWPQHLGPLVRVFAETRDRSNRRTLWAAGQGGVEGWRDGNWTPLARECLPHEEVMDLRVRGEPGAQSLWIATRGGIARVDVDDGFACESLGANALPSATVYQLRHDAVGRVYLFGYDGALRLTPDPAAPTALARMRIERFDEQDGLPALEFNRATFVDPNGRIWAGGVAGVVVFDPAHEPVAQPARPLLLTETAVLDPDEPLEAGALLPAAHNSVRFAYSLMSYEREHLTRYRTQLVGLEPDPRAWTTSPDVTYTRVPPGEYVFRVWGRDAFGTISGPREHAFSVAVPRWQSPLAIGLYLMAFLLAAAAYSRSRSRSLAARAESLAREVDERTRALHDANRQLENASLTDPLTGLANRRHFAARVAGELDARRERGGRSLLCLLDLDWFKNVNDRYGHAAGDEMLVRVARALREWAGDTGAALRWGGEEFLLVRPLPPGDDPAAMAQQLVDAVHRCSVALAGRDVAVTGSVGWTVWPWHPHRPLLVTLDQALTLADQALYRAKEGGRNRAVGAMWDESAVPLVEHPDLRVRWIGRER
ncbi:MAG TPA: diguanylate cyclase [Xanthomonadales bacterium]|nr:diguanylate cyclase [Xanthomonadales bacterium]